MRYPFPYIGNLEKLPLGMGTQLGVGVFHGHYLENLEVDHLQLGGTGDSHLILDKECCELSSECYLGNLDSEGRPHSHLVMVKGRPLLYKG